jgi:5-methylcytosine-specific restriction protein A
VSTGFPDHVRQLIRQRADDICERCGKHLGTQAHHRRPRGAGGSRRDDTNTASNGMWLCHHCHFLIEGDRTLSINLGWLVRQNHSPAEIPVVYRGKFVFLSDDGGLQPVEDVI